MTRKAAGPPDTPRLHNRLAALRAQHGTTRRELAEAVAINVQTVGFLERGDYGPSAELALRLAAHFGLPVEAIFSLTPFPPASAPPPTSTTSPAAATSPTPTTPSMTGANS